MDGDRFDRWTKRLTAPHARRVVLRRLAGGAFGGLLGPLGRTEPVAARNLKLGQRCKFSRECISRFCENDECRCPPSKSRGCRGGHCCARADICCRDRDHCCLKGKQCCKGDSGDKNNCCPRAAECCKRNEGRGGCCPRGQECCKGNSGDRGCCPKGKPECCPPGSDPSCCPPGAACSPSGCVCPPEKPVPCPAGNPDGCCFDDELCCLVAGTGGPGDCCPKERPHCCLPNDAVSCCPPFHTCCRPGDGADCCPEGTRCTPAGCEPEGCPPGIGGRVGSQGAGQNCCPPGADSCAGSGVVACGAEADACECHQTVDGETFCASFFSCAQSCETDADCDAIGGVFAGATCIRCPLVCGTAGACAVPCPPG